MKKVYKKKLWIHLGPGKSGSTWLYNLAKKNSDIFALPKIKETQNFHNSNIFNKEFYDLKCINNSRIICDFSNTYIFNPISISNINKIDYENFDVFSTVLLRCPYKRTLSHYNYLLASGKIPKISFRNLIAEDPSILWRSRYDIHLEYFKKINLNFNAYILEEQNASSPLIIKDVLNKFDFNNKNLDFVNVDKFTAMSSRNHLMSQTAKIIATYLRRKKYYTLLDNLKSNQFVRTIFMKKSSQKNIIIDQDIKYLKLYFEPVKEYCRNLGLNINSWLE